MTATVDAIVQTRKRAWRQFWVGMALYGVLIFATSFTANRLDFARGYLIVLALLPMVPAVWAMLGWIRAIRTHDELQQRIVSEGLHWALGLTSLVSVSYGLLEAYADFPQVSMFVVWPTINVTFIFGQALARRRYR